MLALYFNSDDQTRIWPTLTNSLTGTTLELAAGEKAEIDVPVDFTDTYLHLVTKTATKSKAKAEENNTNEAAPVADLTKE